MAPACPEESHVHDLRGRLLAVHSVYEIITVVGEQRQAQPVIATNIYMNTDRGWRIIVHHASGVSGTRVAEPAPAMLH